MYVLLCDLLPFKVYMVQATVIMIQDHRYLESRRQCVEEVGELSKREQHTCLTKTSRTGDTQLLVHEDLSY
jgi:hypothetical protein